MLNYTINRRFLFNDLDEVRFYDYVVSDDLFDEDRIIVTVNTVDIGRVAVGDKIFVMFENGNANYSETFIVTSVSTDGLSFTMGCPRRYDLPGRRAYMIGVTDDEEPDMQHEYLHIEFWDSHFYEDGLSGQSIYVTEDPTMETEPVNATCEYVDERTVRIPHDMMTQEEWERLVCIVYNVDSATDAVSAEAVSVERLSIQRDTFILNEYNFSNESVTRMYIQKSVRNVDIPLTTSYRTDAFAEDILTQYGQSILKGSINKPVDTEKDVYHPVVMWHDNVSQETKVTKVKRIEFNLHFRERDNTDGKWEVIPGSGWNTPYSRWTVPLERQSDLLTYLGFINDDVRLQKNKLKRSFVRLSFYNSDDYMNNNLLATSTVFYDAPGAFVKYTKLYSEEKKNYVSVTGTFDPESSVYMNGIRVTREYYPEELSAHAPTMTEIEKHRLSSQYVTNDRNSDKSSEGFYLYLWKDVAEDGELYMRVDFNHAGYGRVVPMMYPYDENGVLDYDGVNGLWTAPSGYSVDKKDEYIQANDINRYLDFSYIRIKYGVTDDGFRYYALDDALYKNKEAYYDEDAETLVINLYEGRIYEGVET